MGADMCLAVTELPGVMTTPEDRATAFLAYTADWDVGLFEAYADEQSACYGLLDKINTYGADEEEPTEAERLVRWREAFLERIEKAVRVTHDSSEVTVFSCSCGKHNAASGGMSWGDPPTEAMKHIEFLDAINYSEWGGLGAVEAVALAGAGASAEQPIGLSAAQVRLVKALLSGEGDYSKYTEGGDYADIFNNRYGCPEGLPGGLR